jgi:hypothetical protein
MLKEKVGGLRWWRWAGNELQYIMSERCDRSDKKNFKRFDVVHHLMPC